jgi:hypothetical protein
LISIKKTELDSFWQSDSVGENSKLKSMAWQSEKRSFWFTKFLNAYQRKGFSVFGLIWFLVQRLCLFYI